MKNVIIPPSIKPAPSSVELSVAYIFAQHYQVEVEFLNPRNGYKQRTPDFKSGGSFWEIKSPEGKSLNSIEKHIVNGLKQATNIIIDSRLSKLDDHVIARELHKLANEHRKIQKLLLLDKNESIQEIYIKRRRSPRHLRL